MEGGTEPKPEGPSPLRSRRLPCRAAAREQGSGEPARDLRRSVAFVKVPRRTLRRERSIKAAMACGYSPMGSGARPSAVAPSADYCHTLSVRFTWDRKKAATNLEKHGVSFEEAETAFDDKLGAYYPDRLHETRFILIGYSKRSRLLYVVHAEVATDTIRIIGARKATKNEKKHYEED